MSIRPLVLFATLSAIAPVRNCHLPGRATGREAPRRLAHAPPASDGSARPTRAPDAIDVRIGTPGDRHQLPRNAHRWEDRPARIVMNAPFQAWADEGTFVHAVAFTPSLERCARADFYLGETHVGRADQHGAFAFRKAAGNRVAALRVACEGEDHKWYRGELEFQSHSRSQEFERPIVYVHADRGVYRPGQTVRVRALAWKLRGEYVASPEQTVSVSLEGPDGQPVGGARVHTDDDGVGALDIALPRNLPEGAYKLVATHVPPDRPTNRRSFGWGEAAEPPASRAEAPIQIRRFETPVIEVRHTLGEFLTPAMRTVPFTVTLGYLDGAPFTRARVEVSLGEGDARLALAPREVIGPGPHSFELSAEQLARFRDDRELRVEISAIDATQRRDTVVRTMRVVDNPYRATLELDRNGYAARETVDVALRLIDLDSVVQRGKGVRLQGCGVSLEAQTDDTGVAHFRFAMPPNECSAEAFATDARGAIARLTVPFTSVRPMQSRVAERTIREREPVTITVRFPAGVEPVERVVHGDVTDSSGAIIDSLSIPIETVDGDPRARAILRPPSWGSMLVTLYTLGVESVYRDRRQSIGLLTDGQTLAVGAVSHLTATLHGVEQTLRPGELATVRVDVARDGRPVTAALGVSVVDRGVINMLDPYEHPPFDRFYDPQQKVLASTGAQTLTWPVVQRTWGPDRHDIGWLMSFGMHEGAPPENDAAVLWPERSTARVPGENGIFAALGAADGESGIVSPFGGLTESGADSSNDNLSGDTIGDAFGFGGLGATGTGWGGGGTGEGTIGLGSFGTIGHGTGTGLRGRRGGAGGEVQNTRGRALVDDEPSAAAPLLIVRTGADDTSLWLPRARGGGSAPALQVRVPETIGEHQINVLASDRQGGIALARATLTVRQPLYVRADVPDTLTAGDVATVTLVARNITDSPVEVDFALRAPHWTVEPLEPAHATVAARGQRAVRYRVTAQRAGRARYEAEARAASLVDVLRADTWVRPAGSPSHERLSQSLSPAQPRWSATVSDTLPDCVATAQRSCSAGYRVARLSVALPESTAWEPAMDYASHAGRDELRAVAAMLTASIELADAEGPAAVRERAEALAAESLFALLGFAQDERAQAALNRSLRATASLVESLARAKRAGYRLPQSALQSALDRLGSQLRPSIPESDRMIALRALLIGRRDELLRQWGPDRDARIADGPFAAERTLVAAHARIERGVGADASTFVEALRLWTAFAANEQAFPTLKSRLIARLTTDAGPDAGPHAPSQLSAIAIRAARALLAWRRQQTVEPGSWGSSDRVYATAAALLALHELAPREAAGELREVSAFLRSHRARWESWASPETSALALRALSLAGTRRERDGAEVIVRVDGREARRVRIDPSDPWASALSLRQIELDEAIGAGPGVVEVEYTGALAAQVSLDIERWSALPAIERSNTLSATTPERATRGAIVPVRVHAGRPSGSRATELWLTLPPYARIEERALDRLVTARAIASWAERDGLLVLGFSADADTLDATVELRLARPGRYSLSALEVRDPSGRREGITGPVILVE